MVYIEVCNSMIYIDPFDVQKISLNELSMIIEFKSKCDDIIVTFDDKKEAKRSYDELKSLLRQTSVSTISMNSMNVDFKSKDNENMVDNVFRKHLDPDVYEKIKDYIK